MPLFLLGIELCPQGKEKKRYSSYLYKDWGYRLVSRFLNSQPAREGLGLSELGLRRFIRELQLPGNEWFCPMSGQTFRSTAYSIIKTSIYLTIL